MKKYAKLIITLGLAGGIMLQDVRKMKLRKQNRQLRRSRHRKQRQHRNRQPWLPKNRNRPKIRS